jgi:hypothetical protein
MQRTDDNDSLPEGAREFRAHLTRLQWGTEEFAQAARIKHRTARAIWRGDREMPATLMTWLRSLSGSLERLPAAPWGKGGGMRSQYTWTDDGETVRIVDADAGGMSVTNDAENVIARLVAVGVPVDQRRVIYCDSEGRWDRMLTENGAFCGFKAGE